MIRAMFYYKELSFRNTNEAIYLIMNAVKKILKHSRNVDYDTLNDGCRIYTKDRVLYYNDIVKEANKRRINI